MPTPIHNPKMNSSDIARKTIVLSSNIFAYANNESRMIGCNK